MNKSPFNVKVERAFVILMSQNSERVACSDEIRIVIGSWGSYNEYNERALGSKWLTLSDFTDWDEIVEELKKEGFELDGMDEECRSSSFHIII